MVHQMFFEARKETNQNIQPSRFEIGYFIYESEISEWTARETANQARSLANYILQGNFIITLFVSARVLALGHLLSKQLQRINLDLRSAVSSAEISILSFSG